MLAVLDLEVALQGYVDTVLPAVIGLVVLGTIAVFAFLAQRGMSGR